MAWRSVSASAQSVETAWPAACPFAGDSLRTPPGGHIDPGEYALVMRGSDSVGAIIAGRLALVEAKSTDRSTRTNQPVREGARRVVLVGWTDAKLESAGVEVDSGRSPPTSRDPVFPGVLVEYQGTSEQSVMEIGSGHNSRNNEDPNHPGWIAVGADGPGAGF